MHGPYASERGLRFNPAKLLIDPYAKAIEGGFDWQAANTLPYLPGAAQDADLEIDDCDDAAAIPRGVVIDSDFDWGDDRLLGRSWSSTVIYETHVKAFTIRHPEIPEALRGTYAGLASEPPIEHRRGLGITAVELLPVHHIADESFLIEKGLSNYWGYSEIGYFAPHCARRLAGCNWLTSRRGDLCRSCALTRTRPTDADTGHGRSCTFHPSADEIPSADDEN